MEIATLPIWMVTSAAGFAGFYCIWYAAIAATALAPQWRDRLAANVDKNGTTDLEKFRSTIVAVTHAYAVGIAGLYFAWSAMEDGVFAAGDAVLQPVGDRRLSSGCVALSNGYMLYDLISMLRLGLFRMPPIYPVHLHHVVVMICFTTALSIDHDRGTGVGTHFATALALCLACEINTALLATHKLARQLGLNVTKSPVAWILDALFIVSFVLTRVFLHTWIAFKMWVLRAQVTPAFGFYMAFGGTLAILALDLLLLKEFVSSRIKIYGDGPPLGKKDR